MNRVLHWAPVGLGVMFLLSLVYMQRERTFKGQNDFVQLYTAAKLAGTPDLYSRAANLATIQGILGFTMDGVEVTRPPFYAALLKPLAVFPYRVAYAVFSLATFSSLLWFVIRFSKECSALPFFVAISIPLLSPFATERTRRSCRQFSASPYFSPDAARIFQRVSSCRSAPSNFTFSCSCQSCGCLRNDGAP